MADETVDARPRSGSVPRASDQLQERDWKIIEAMYRLSPNGPKVVTYEDIVVKAWELYPGDFGLRGYSDKYPDSSDLHKRLYNELKSRGWVKTGPKGQKKFTLTTFGWERASDRFAGNLGMGAQAERAARVTLEELKYLEATKASELFHTGRKDEILDTDFFAFFRTSVRAPAQEFEGRLAQVSAALQEGRAKKVRWSDELIQVDAFLREKYASIVLQKSERKKREG
jgi:hypothetical protein